MKKDTLYLLGGVAVGAVAFFLFKDKLLGSAKRADDSTPMPSTDDASSQDVPIGAPTEVIQGSQEQQQSQVQSEPALPYALTPIDPALASTQAHQDIFGGCDFPLTPDESNICVRRLQEAFDVEQTSTFDMPTQEALDSFIENLPNRDSSPFKGYGRQGCITSDPQAGESNLCGLNHDQYLDILFKMGIPLTQDYDA
tara:strand:+ start:60 stop:650 length:591 start_codon:yes stop_codon:yes gene_type:complete